MKRIFALIVSLLSLHSVSIAQLQLKSEVDECFELTSIAFRIAGAEEYVNNDIENYAKDIDDYFTKYNQHKLIEFIKEIRQNNGIGYDAVSTVAAILEINNGKIVAKQDVNIAKISEIDNRWSKQDLNTFVALLNDFYKRTKFNTFYDQHSDLYRVAKEKMDYILCRVNTDWFKSFFGEELQPPRIVVSLTNGRNNYAFALQSPNFGIAIGSKADDNGLPMFSNMSVFTIIHEICHNFTNRRIFNIWDKIDSAAQKIYPYVQQQMSNNAYGSAQTTMIEGMNNLFTLMYFKENPFPKISNDFLLLLQQERGFIWIDRSVRFMNHFYDNRYKYTTIDDFMPYIVDFVNYTADDFEQVVAEYNNRRPYIVDIFPPLGSTLTQGTDKLEIRFSEPMFVAHGLKPVGDSNILSIPLSMMPFWKDEYTYIMPLNISKLEPNKVYGSKLSSNFFQSKRLYNMVSDFIYTFNTNE